MLGVDSTTDEDDIKAAFRRKVKELHPDVNKNVSQLVGRVGSAWSWVGVSA